MQIIIAGMVAVAVGASVIALAYILRANQMAVSRRLKTYVVENDDNGLPPELNLPLGQRLSNHFTPVLKQLVVRLVPANKRDIYQKKLLAAGKPYGMDVEKFLSMKYGLTIAAFGLGLFSGSLLYIFIYGLIAYAVPDIWLKVNEEKRRDAILKSLPDILDLLSVSVEAGLSFDGAIKKVIEKSEGPLAREFELALKEIEIGKPRRDALKDMSERVGVDDVSVFVGSVIQAEQLGVSLTNVLKLQAGQVREGRKMRAEEKAQKAPVKILIPLVLFIFPTILIVLLGPAALKMMDTL